MRSIDLLFTMSTCSRGIFVNSLYLFASKVLVMLPGVGLKLKQSRLLFYYEL